MSRRAEGLERSRCPCGEALEVRPTAHILCPKHRQKVVSGVARRFGRHRYGGRYADSVEDFVNECYEKLLRPGGLDRYDAALGGERNDPFGGWLWRVVQNFCNNKLDSIPTEPVGGSSHGIEPIDRRTPEQDFLQECARTLVRTAVADVEAAWKARGPTWSQRFDTFLPFVLDENASYKEAQAKLGISESNAKKIKCDLHQDIRLALRRRVRDTLVIEPGLNHEGIERRIDRELEELLKAAFPDGSEPAPMQRKPKPEDEKPEPEGGKPEPNS